MGLRGPLPKAPATKQGHHAVKPTLSLVPASADAPAVAAPAPPSGIGPAALERWAAFWSSGVASAVDRGADIGRLERWIRAWDELDTVRPAFIKKRIVSGSQGQPVLNPLSGYLKDLEAVITSAEDRYGMTPQARARLGLTVGQARLTAAQLNGMLNKGRDDDDAGEDGEWTEG